MLGTCKSKVRALQLQKLSWRSGLLVRTSAAFGLQCFHFYPVLGYHLPSDRRWVRTLRERELAQSRQLAEGRQRCSLVPAEDLVLTMRSGANAINGNAPPPSDPLWNSYDCAGCLILLIKNDGYGDFGSGTTQPVSAGTKANYLQSSGYVML